MSATMASYAGCTGCPSSRLVNAVRAASAVGATWSTGICRPGRLVRRQVVERRHEHLPLARRQLGEPGEDGIVLRHRW